MEFGIGPADLPFHRFGDGSRRLVLVPGLFDSLGWNRPSKLGANLLSRYYFRSYRAVDVWVLSRPPGLSPDVTVDDMASQYRVALAELGPAHVMGFPSAD